VGANQGLYLEQLIELSDYVYAFEPNQELSKELPRATFYFKE